MVTKAALDAAKAAYDIEAACITEMKDYFDDEQFAKAVELLASAQRIGAAGSGHSGIICQHFAHLMCCIERPARFISPAEAVHGATGFIQQGDVMVFSSFTPGEGVAIYDASGRLLQQHAVASDGTLQIPLHSFAKGVYIVKTESITYKFMKK